MKEYTGDRGWYVTPNKIDSQTDAKNTLQLPDLENGRYRCSITTDQAKDNLKVPKGNINEPIQPFEPLTRDFDNFGDGGGPQLLLESREVIIDDVFDTVEQRALTLQEIQQLLSP